MLNLSTATRIFLATTPVDLRAIFKRLGGLVQLLLRQASLCCHWFVFATPSRNRVKILVWDGSCLWVLGKRLERCRFTWTKGRGSSAGLRPEYLGALLSGLEVTATASWYPR